MLRVLLLCNIFIITYPKKSHFRPNKSLLFKCISSILFSFELQSAWGSLFHNCIVHFSMTIVIPKTPIGSLICSYSY